MMQYGGSESVLLTTDDVILYTPQTQQNTILLHHLQYYIEQILAYTLHISIILTRDTPNILLPTVKMLLVGNIILLTSFRHD